jgi:hypothetical protein
VAPDRLALVPATVDPVPAPVICHSTNDAVADWDASARQYQNPSSWAAEVTWNDRPWMIPGPNDVEVPGPVAPLPLTPNAEYWVMTDYRARCW